MSHQGAPTEPRAADGEVVECSLPWSTPVLSPIIPSPISNSPSNAPVTLPPYSSNLTVHLPLSSHLLYFLARGSHAKGVLRIVAAEDLVGSDQVRVDVQVRYWRFEYRNRANLCLLRREEGAHGLGIYVRRHTFVLADKPAEYHYHFSTDRRSKVATYA